VNDGTYCQARTLLFKRPAFILKSAHISTGVHHEHFLYHRRRGSYHLCCRLLWSARLNMEWKIRLVAAVATLASGRPFQNQRVRLSSISAGSSAAWPRFSPRMQLIEDRIVADAAHLSDPPAAVLSR
jgi:hypothetical protein